MTDKAPIFPFGTVLRGDQTSPNPAWRRARLMYVAPMGPNGDFEAVYIVGADDYREPGHVECFTGKGWEVVSDDKPSIGHIHGDAELKAVLEWTDLGENDPIREEMA